mmetsp:Transcript_88283/g.250192  ORF Transcript_88283/g.250192 Transcript_88283/m.250192 type:complete len:351 (+) Transcript_88283:58-1110(+)
MTILLLLGLVAAASGLEAPTAVDDAVSLFSFGWMNGKPTPEKKPWAGCKNCCQDGSKHVPCLNVHECAAKGPRFGKYAFVYSQWSPLRSTRFLDNIESLEEYAGKYGMDIVLLMLQKDIDATQGHILKRIDREKVKLVPVDWDVPPGMLFRAASGAATTMQTEWCGPRDLMRLHLFGLTDYDAVAYYDTDVEIQGDVLPMLRCAASGQILTTTGSDAPINGGFIAARPDPKILEASMLFAKRANFNLKSGWGGSGYKPWTKKFEGAECGNGFMHTLFYKAKSGTSPLAVQCFHDAGIKLDNVGVSQLDRCVWNYDGSQECGSDDDNFDCSIVRVHHKTSRKWKHSCQKQR